MAIGQTSVFLRYVCNLMEVQKCSQQTDRDLLHRFTKHHDESAFLALLQRHGPMVLSVSQRILHNEHDAEDVFQATFLVLLKKADRVRWRDSVANWLHEVVYRLAVKVRTETIRREIKESLPQNPDFKDSVKELTLREAQVVLHEELGGLPESLRAPLVLCYLESATQDDAARQLGWSLRTFKRRLERGKAMLHLRLSRRGLTLSAALSTALLASSTASAGLIQSTLQVSVSLVTGKAAGAISARVAALVQGAMGSMFLVKLKLMATLVVLAGFLGTGLALTVSHLQPAPPVALKPAAPPITLVAKDEAGEPVRAGLERPAVDQYGDPLPSGAVARIGTERFRHQGEARSVAFSPNGKLLAASSAHGLIYLWDSATGKEVRRLTVRDQGGHHVLAIDFSPDGKLLASRGLDRSVRIWEIATGKEFLKIELQERMPGDGHVCFTPDGKAFVVESVDIVGGRVESRLSFFDTTTGKNVVTRNLRGQIGSFAFGRGGKLIAVSVFQKEGSAVEIWDPASWTKLRSLPEHDFGRAITFSEDGRMLASGTKDQIVVSDVGTGKVLAQLKAAMDMVMGLAFTPDGKTLISAGQDGKVIFWDLATMKVRFQRDARMWMIRSMALSRDGKTVAVGTVYNAIRLWDVASGRELSEAPEEPDAPINSIAFSPDGKLLATGGDNHHICLWEVPSGRPHRRFSSPNSASSVVFSPDGKLLATVWSNSKIARLWSVATGEIVGELKREDISARWVAFSPDGWTLVTAHSGLWHSGLRPTSLNVWQTKDGKHLREDRLQTASLEAMACAPDGKTLAIGTANGTVHIWDIRAGKEITRLTGHKRSVSSVAFSPDGKILSSGSADQTVKLWNPGTWKEILSLKGHQRAVTSVAFSPDGRMLASGSGNPHFPTKANSPQRIRFWEVATGMEITHVQSHHCDVTALAFSPDGSRMASALGNSTALLWDIGAVLQPPGFKCKPLTAQDLGRLWNDLADADARKAYQAIWALTDKPEKSIPLFRERLKPVAATDAGKINRWIADLDSGQFPVRQAAVMELEKLGGQAELPVQKALEGKISLETRRRLEQLLETLQGVPGSNTRRSLRAITALERIGSPEAMKVLEILAQGAPAARETCEAKASLQRLAK